MSIFDFFKTEKYKPNGSESFLGSFCDVQSITSDGYIFTSKRNAFMFELDGIDISFFDTDQLSTLHSSWRSALRLMANEEIQIVFRKRVEFTKWIEEQLSQAFLADSLYGRRILLNRLSDQVQQMSEDEPKLLNQKIIVCFWTNKLLNEKELNDKRQLIKSQLDSFGVYAKILEKNNILKEINASSQDTESVESHSNEWPAIDIEPSKLKINRDLFRSLDLYQLPEKYTELGMIQSITNLPYPLDICLRLKGRDSKPIIKRLERKRNMLHAKRANKNSPSPESSSQINQIDEVLQSFADKSESIFDMNLTIGLRLPEHLEVFQRKAIETIIRSGSQMDFSDFEESTIGTFDSYLECIPGFSGKNIHSHTILGSNAIHFLPFFCPSKGDYKSVISFRTRNGNFYGINPTDSHLANYNWLVSGTSGSGKSFFVNSLLAQSISLDPNIFIVDIGGSYNKLTSFLNGRVMSLQPGQGFQLSPFFISKSPNPTEERMRRQHIYQIFLEMTRIDGKLPSIEIRHLLFEILDELFDMKSLPEHPITYIVDKLSTIKSNTAHRLKMLLLPWCAQNFFGQFLDNNKESSTDDRVLTFDLKGLTEFEDLSRVVQFIVCASLWARVRQTDKDRFSWIVLDEVAFSLLKTQPEFVDELVSTLRKYFAGAVTVVQDLEKITSNLAGSSILQNTNSKAILQQRGNPKNYSEVLSLNKVDQMAINSLQQSKGSYSEVFLIRNGDKALIRYVPSPLEYWLSTTAPEDSHVFDKWIKNSKGAFSNKVIDFVDYRKGAEQ